MAHKVIVPQKKKYVPQFLKQRDINSYILIFIYISDLRLIDDDEDTRKLLIP
jgi:hypothetical protein